MIKQAILAATLVVGATVSANAVPVTLFEDNFDGQSQATNASLNGWTVSNGTIDVIGAPNFFNLYPGNGNYLDMDGSNLNGGKISTVQTFDILAGVEYFISFSYGKNEQNGNLTPESLNFGFDTLTPLNLALTAASIGSLVNVTYSFISATGANDVSLFFEDLGGDNQGVILDNVKLSAVPLPAAAPLFLMGLAGLGAMARRRRAKISV